ncbi:MAG: APC family permease [Puniceicoccales bacterium]|jgi:amino acid transporter|nr:APC family permease [Puniceicoccales bacterium]
MKTKKKSLGVLALTMINFAAILNLRNLPLLSTYGMAMIIFYLIAALCFFVPTALISAELASAFVEEGGMFAWVSRAIGGKIAFFCEWIGFITTVTALTTTIVCLTASLALSLASTLSNSKLCICTAVIGSVWLATFLALRGTRFTSRIITVASTVGTILPIALMVVLGIYWIASGNPISFELSAQSLWPDFSNFSNISFLAGIMFAFAGIEMSAYYVNDVRNPSKTYPRAILCSMVLILGVSLLGSMAIAMVVPAGTIRIEAGVMQAIGFMLEAVHCAWLTPVIGSLMVFGGIAFVFAWIAGPARGIYAVRHTGFLPPFLQKTNAMGIPVAILYYQALMVTILAGLFLFIPSVSLCFWIIDASAAVMMLMHYACLFATGIILRYKLPHAPRTYRVPFGNIGMITLGSVGIANILLCITISFFVPTEMRQTMPQSAFAWLLCGITLLLLCPPFIFIAARKPHWKA